MITRITNLIKSILLQVYYTIVNRLSKRKLVGIDQQFVISMTTYTERINYVYLTIESLFNQRLRPTKICLWLSEVEFPDHRLPASLLRLQKRGLEIYFVPGNIRSYKKLVYALEKFPNSVIITTDDDLFYPRYWYADLVKAHQQNPGIILCGRGHYLFKNEEGNLATYLQITEHNRTGSLMGYNLMPTGVSGILYPPQSLNPVVMDQELFLRLAPTADDIWFKACALLNNTKCMRIYPMNKRFHKVRAIQNTGLAKINVVKNQNDVQLKQVFDYFDLYKYI